MSDVRPSPQSQTYVWDGSAWIEARQAPTSDAQAVTGIMAAGLMAYNGSTWDRVRGGHNQRALYPTA